MMNIELFKQYYKNGYWNENMINSMVEQGVITSEDKIEILKTPKEAKIDPRVLEENEFTFEIWDKKKPINGCPAEKILENEYQMQNAENVYLIKQNGVVTNIEIPDTLRVNNKMRNGLSDDEVIEYYIEQLKSYQQPQTNNEAVMESLTLYSDVMNAACINSIQELLIQNNAIMLEILEALKNGR